MLKWFYKLLNPEDFVHEAKHYNQRRYEGGGKSLTGKLMGEIGGNP